MREIPSEVLQRWKSARFCKATCIRLGEDAFGEEAIFAAGDSMFNCFIAGTGPLG